jgi:hypothetical protein
MARSAPIEDQPVPARIAIAMLRYLAKNVPSDQADEVAAAMRQALGAGLAKWGSMANGGADPAMDAANSASFAEFYPAATRIGLAYDNRPAPPPRHQDPGDGGESFYALFPEARRILG